MPIQLDITDPASNQRVGTNVCVIGSYSGDDGTPFVIKCFMINEDINTHAEVVASIDTLEGTWQATFNNLPESESDGRGSYVIRASVNDVLPVTNLVTGVEVTTSSEITLDAPAPITTPKARTRGSAVRITGTYLPGYGLANGYVVNAYLTLGGKRVCEAGRLHKMKDGKWEYRFRVRPRDKIGILHVELWRVNAVGDDQIPVVTLSESFSLNVPRDGTA